MDTTSMDAMCVLVVRVHIYLVGSSKFNGYQQQAERGTVERAADVSTATERMSWRTCGPREDAGLV